MAGAPDSSAFDPQGAAVTGVDLNADVGEAADPATDLMLFDVITSANVACGGHAGDRRSMTRSCEAAVARNVVIGAQVSYPDREGFGRRRLDIAPSDLRASLADQFRKLSEAADAAGTTVSYLKPHGALYHAAIDEPEIAEIIVELAASWGIPLLTMGFGQLREQARSSGIPVYHEAFLDRGYTPDGRLTPRDEPGAVLGIDAVIARLRIWIDRSFHGAHSLCVHSDSPDAITIARRSRDLLAQRSIRVASFLTMSEPE